MERIVDEDLIYALDAYKEQNGISSDTKLAKLLNVSQSMISSWRSTPGMTIRSKVWARIKDELTPLMEAVTYDPKTLAELEKFDEDVSDHYIMAKMAQDLGKYKYILPERALSLPQKKRDALKKIIMAALEVM